MKIAELLSGKVPFSSNLQDAVCVLHKMTTIHCPVIHNNYKMPNYYYM